MRRCVSAMVWSTTRHSATGSETEPGVLQLAVSQSEGLAQQYSQQERLAACELKSIPGWDTVEACRTLATQCDLHRPASAGFAKLGLLLV